MPVKTRDGSVSEGIEFRGRYLAMKLPGVEEGVPTAP